MATVEDARRLLTDPTYVVMGASLRDDMVEMSAARILVDLRAADPEEAARLLFEALEQLGGVRWTTSHTGGLRPNGPRRQEFEHIAVPESALRKES